MKLIFQRLKEKKEPHCKCGQKTVLSKLPTTNYKLRTSGGFSLLELLIYIGLLSAIIAIIGAIFISINKGRGQAEARMEVNSALNFAMEKISQDIRSASAVTTPASGTSETLAITVSGSTTTYCVVSGVLKRATTGGTCDGSAESITTSSVTMSAPAFTRLENTNATLSKTVVSVEITLTASYNSQSPDWQYSQTKKTTASLR